MTTFAVAAPPSQRLIDWIKHRIPEEYGYADWDPAQTLCTLLLDEKGEPIVATAVDGFSGHSCDLTIASDGTQRWATPKFICGTYEFIFRAPALNRVSMITAASNVAAIRMHEALGHVQEGVHRDYFGPGRDAISFSYLRSDWLASRWYARSNRSRSVNKPNSKGATDGQEIRGRGRPDGGVHDGVDGPGPEQSADGSGGHAS